MLTAATCAAQNAETRFDAFDNPLPIGFGPEHYSIACHHNLSQVRRQSFEYASRRALKKAMVVRLDTTRQPVNRKHASRKAFLFVDLQMDTEPGIGDSF